MNTETLNQDVTGALLGIAVFFMTNIALLIIYPFLSSVELSSASTIEYIITISSVVGTIFLLIFVVFYSLALLERFERPNLVGQGSYDLIGKAGLAGILAAAVMIATGFDSMQYGSFSSVEDYAGLLTIITLLVAFYGQFSRSSVSRIQLREKPTEPSQEYDDYERAFAVNADLNGSNNEGQTENPSDENNTESPSEQRNQSKVENKEFHWQTETDVSFNDVGGMKELKKELREDILVPIKEKPELAAELGITAPNIVFHGPPGTGKTFLAEALATELELPFAKLSGVDLQSKWINESAEKVNTLFAEAIQVADQAGGAVIFLDELDSVLKERTGGSNTHEEDMKVVNEFLNHLEDINEHNIVFIGATNRLEALDEAGIRSGRIDKRIKVGRPDQEARQKILRAQLSRKPNGTSERDREEIATMMDGMVASDIELVVKQAARDVLMGKTEEITVTTLRKAVEAIDSS